MSDEPRPIIIKKIKKGGHGAHGGAWKLAYADFVTAMMAFFLLMWLLSATTEEQKLGISDYFRPTIASDSNSGAEGVMAGNSLADEGAQSSGSVMVSVPNTPPRVQKSEGGDDSDATDAKDDYQDRLTAAREERLLLEAENNLKDMFNKNPDLSKLSDQIIIDRTPEGLRIQIVDRPNRSTFRDGTATVRAHGRTILREVAKVISNLPNRIKIAGHTDASGFRGKANYSNWELSADRANAARRELLLGGLPRNRIYQVTGKADTEPLMPDDPFKVTNRRITILLLREAPVLPPSHSD